MSGADFLDTNVLVYAYDANHPEKQQSRARTTGSGSSWKAVISTQVPPNSPPLLLHKISPPANADAVMKALDALAPIRLITPDGNWFVAPSKRARPMASISTTA